MDTSNNGSRLNRYEKEIAEHNVYIIVLREEFARFREDITKIIDKEQTCKAEVNTNFSEIHSELTKHEEEIEQLKSTHSLWSNRVFQVAALLPGIVMGAVALVANWLN